MKLLRHCALGLLIAAAPATADARPDTVTIERKLTVGLRVKVKERRSSNLKIHYKDRGTAAGSAEKNGLVQRYTQEVRKIQPEILVRDYAFSERTKVSKGMPNAKELTSVHGRRVLVAGLGIHPDGGTFKVSKRDREMVRFDRLAEALLPPQKVVKLRESWSIAGAALAGAMWGPGVARGGKGCNAKVTLTKVKQVKGREVATLKAKVRIRIPRSEDIPGIQFDLKGEVKWDLEDHVMLEASFTGPIGYSFKNTKAGERSEWSAKGSMRWSYDAELLASRAPRDKLSRKRGDPPPPGTQTLVCSLNPAHKLQLKHYPNCTTCGKKYDKNFKCGAKDHGWSWQYCPHDGAPLEPDK